MIYLDNAATTKIDKAILDDMMPYLQEEYGNPGSLSSPGRAAKKAVQEAREAVASFIGAQAEDIIFTSGGSEANNLAIKGASELLKGMGLTDIVASSIEHHSTLAALEHLEKDGFNIIKVNPNKSGEVELSDIYNNITDKTGLCCVMAANNETGVVNDIKRIGEMCDDLGILFMVDCVQAAGVIPIDVNEIRCDFLSISSHKLHGPKGVGALYCRCRSIMEPLICGGKDQEFGLRGGTENVAGIVGFGAAISRSKDNFSIRNRYISDLKGLFYGELNSRLTDAGIAGCMHVNGMPFMQPGKVLSLTFDGVDGETLVMMLDTHGVCVSAGSACNSTEQVPSHVLTAMGLTDEQARSTIRVSFSKMNTIEDVIEGAGIIADCVAALKGGIKVDGF